MPLQILLLHTVISYILFQNIQEKIKNILHMYSVRVIATNKNLKTCFKSDMTLDQHLKH